MGVHRNGMEYTERGRQTKRRGDRGKKTLTNKGTNEENTEERGKSERKRMTIKKNTGTNIWVVKEKERDKDRKREPDRERERQRE